MEELYFREITNDDECLIQEYINEFVENASELNGLSGANYLENFQQMIQLQQERKNLEFQTYEQDNAPQITFVLVRKIDEKIVGSFNLRKNLIKDLDDRLAGHIGYSVRPSERRKGYATLGLKMALDIYREWGVKFVRLGCYDKNIGSKKAILKNGGVLIAQNKSLKTKNYYEITL